MLDFLQTLLAKIILIGTAILLFFGIGDTLPIKEVPPLDSPKAISATTTVDFETDTIPEVTPPSTIPRPSPAPVPGEPTQEEKPPAPSLVITLEPEEVIEEEQESVIIPPSFLNQKVRETVVNIFCLSKSGGLFQPIVASGVIIDTKGIILTNAHTAQYFLLKNYRTQNFIDCIIRTGSPATPTYRAELLYLPPTWIEENAHNIVLQKPRGSGEHDYALLRITRSARRGTPLPASFPAVDAIGTLEEIQKGTPVLAASYPAGFLGSIGITKGLWLTSSISHIMDVFTLKDDPPYTPDIFSIGGIISAQEGSSGGAVVSLKNGRLLGIIVTRTSGETTEERDLRVLSIPHINQSLEDHTGEGVQEFLAGDIEKKAEEFRTTIAPQLTQILTNVLDK